MWPHGKSAAALLLTIAWCALGWSVPSLAQQPGAGPRPTNARARSAVHIDRGRKLYDLRRYDRAIAEFEKAYEIDADPNHLYNIAQAHRLATNIDKAIQYYQSYLEKVPGAPNRADVEGRIAELQKARRPPNTLEPAPGGAPTVLSGPPPLATPDDAPLILPGEATYTPPAWGAAPAPAPLLGDPGVAPYGYYPPGYGAPPPAAPTLSARAPEPTTGRRHDGLFVRLQAGPGYLHTNIKDRGLRLKGPGGAFALALGGTVAGRVAIYGELGLGLLPGPTVTLNGAELENDERLRTFVYALGAALFFDPSNVYLSLSLGAADLRGQGNYASKVGGGATASVGKEWWVAADLGIGGALQVHGSIVEDSDAGNAKIGTLWIAALLSATFN